MCSQTTKLPENIVPPKKASGVHPRALPSVTFLCSVLFFLPGVSASHSSYVAASPPPPSPAPPPPFPPPPVWGVAVAGGCNSASGSAAALNYAMQGTTASGAPYYKADGASYWLYWDPSCDGVGGATWEAAPNTNCYPAALCDGVGGVGAQCHSCCGRDTSYNEATVESCKARCAAANGCDGITYSPTNNNCYLRHQIDFSACSTGSSYDSHKLLASGVTNGGSGSTYTGWLLDYDAPSTTATSDLDGDGACNYAAHINSGDSSSPPQGLATWRAYCNSSWTDTDVTISPQRAGDTALEVTSDVTLDTNALPGGFSYYSLVIRAGATLKATGSNPLIINVASSVDIQGTIDLSGGKGGNSAGDHKAAGGGAGGGALKISAPTITIGPAGAIYANGGDGGDGGGPGQNFFGSATPWSTGAGNGAGGVGIAGGGAGGAGGGSSQSGIAGSGPGASAGGPTQGSVPPGAGGAGHAFAGTNGFGQYSSMTPAGGAAYGDAQLTAGLQGGSGAGGGGNDDDNEEGAGGGGSGGTVYLVAAALHIDGALIATGGLGGRDDYHYSGGANRECCNNGGPGSVGRIRIDYDTLKLSGSTTIAPAAIKHLLV